MMGRTFVDHPGIGMAADEFIRRAVAEGFDHSAFGHDCHGGALCMVRLVGAGRVARGWHPSIGGQHSWVVVGNDCYDPHAPIVDPTLWSYDTSVHGIWFGRADRWPHRPHGDGSIFNYGKPHHHGGDTITLRKRGPWSRNARDFLATIGPLDYRGWSQLAHAPVAHGWPAGEIIAAMYADKRLKALLPIDIVGMATDLNPSGLYLPQPKESP